VEDAGEGEEVEVTMEVVMGRVGAPPRSAGSSTPAPAPSTTPAAPSTTPGPDSDSLDDLFHLGGRPKGPSRGGVFSLHTQGEVSVTELARLMDEASKARHMAPAKTTHAPSTAHARPTASNGSGSSGNGSGSTAGSIAMSTAVGTALPMAAPGTSTAVATPLPATGGKADPAPASFSDDFGGDTTDTSSVGYTASTIRSVRSSGSSGGGRDGSSVVTSTSSAGAGGATRAHSRAMDLVHTWEVTGGLQFAEESVRGRNRSSGSSVAGSVAGGDAAVGVAGAGTVAPPLPSPALRWSHGSLVSAGDEAATTAPAVGDGGRHSLTPNARRAAAPPIPVITSPSGLGPLVVVVDGQEAREGSGPATRWASGALTPGVEAGAGCPTPSTTPTTDRSTPRRVRWAEGVVGGLEEPRPVSTSPRQSLSPRRKLPPHTKAAAAAAQAKAAAAAAAAPAAKPAVVHATVSGANSVLEAWAQSLARGSVGQGTAGRPKMASWQQVWDPSTHQGGARFF
jgi:hypothetical protein